METSGDQEDALISAIAMYMARIVMNLGPLSDPNNAGKVATDRIRIEEMLLDSRSELSSCLFRYRDAHHRLVLHQIFELFGLRRVAGRGQQAAYLPTNVSIKQTYNRFTSYRKELCNRIASAEQCPNQKRLPPKQTPYSHRDITDAFFAAVPEAKYFAAVPRGHLQVNSKVNLKLTADKKRRDWDVGTGIAYAPNLDEVLVPALIRVCPFYGGCLQPGETIASSVKNALRGLTVDAGFAVATLDRAADARRGSNITLIAGASYSLVSFVSIGAGVIAFENRQSGNWNLTYQVNATLNLRDAIELLEGLRGVKPKLSSDSSK